MDLHGNLNKMKHGITTYCTLLVRDCNGEQNTQ